MKYIIEVPDDMEYALLTGQTKTGYYSQSIEFAELEKTVEPKTGHWIIYTVSPFDGEDVKCSECGQRGCATYWNYCPNCGSYNGGENEI